LLHSAQKTISESDSIDLPDSQEQLQERPIQPELQELRLPEQAGYP